MLFSIYVVYKYIFTALTSISGSNSKYFTYIKYNFIFLILIYIYLILLILLQNR